MKEIMHCKAIWGLEKNFPSDDLGKWFLLTTKSQEEVVKNFVDQKFPRIFKCFNKETKSANKIYPFIKGPRCEANKTKEDSVDFLAQLIQAGVTAINKGKKTEDNSRPPQND